MTEQLRRGQQIGIRTTIMRGGTSKGLYFHAADLPEPGARRDNLLLRLMGSPDVLQIDGLGGSRPITSKVAVIAPSTRPDADVDYTFAQVDIDKAAVHWNGNCGNISSAVGPFAIDEGLVDVPPGATTVGIRIHNTNTGKLLTAIVPVIDGTAAVSGTFAIPGVPGTGAEIVMDWSATRGSRTGALLPTGRPVDTIELSNGRAVAATLCDIGNPAVWISAGAVDANGSELSDEINNNEPLRTTLREIRAKAAQTMGLCTDWTRADTESPGVPVIGMVAPPEDYATLNGGTANHPDMDIRVRLMFMDRLHESLAGTASVNLAAASRVPGSVVATASAAIRGRNELRAGHPSGIMSIAVETEGVAADGLTPQLRLIGISRTARRLADVVAWIPEATLRS